jgi:hypothetical protein
MGGGIGGNHDRGRQGWGGIRRKARTFLGGDGDWILPRISTVMRSEQERGSSAGWGSDNIRPTLPCSKR